jgi:hypothetical protein
VCCEPGMELGRERFALIAWTRAAFALRRARMRPRRSTRRLRRGLVLVWVGTLIAPVCASISAPLVGRFISGTRPMVPFVRYQRNMDYFSG